MKRTVLTFGLLVMILAGAGPRLLGTIHAQEGPQPAPTLSSLSVGLWPEYDRPEMLAVLRGQFGAEAALPLAVQLRIPANAGEPSAVAYVDQGQALNVEFSTRSDGDWLVVSFELPTREFQLEYYAPIQTEGDQRSYTHVYPGDYAVTLVDLEAQVPPTAQDYRLTPASDAVTQDSVGLSYHTLSAGPLAMGETASWTVTYGKGDDLLTVDGLTSSPTAPAAPTVAPAEEGSSSTVLIFLIAFVALVAVGAGAFWLGRRVEASPHPSPADRRSAPDDRLLRGEREAAKGSRTSLDDALFCPECGARLRPDADYCHKCGKALRR